jgi:uncharacterized membrane protein
LTPRHVAVPWTLIQSYGASPVDTSGTQPERHIGRVWAAQRGQSCGNSSEQPRSSDHSGQICRVTQRHLGGDAPNQLAVVSQWGGKVKIEETGDPSGKKWAKRGAIAGGVVGLIFPPSIVVSAVVGGGAGGLWGKIRDKGFKDEDLKEIGNSLPPGSSAIIAVAEDRMVEQLERALGGYNRIAKHAVSAEAAAAIVADVEDET